MRGCLIVLLIVIVIFALGIYAGKAILLAKVKSVVTDRFEYATGKGITIENMGLMPSGGLSLRGVALYTDKSHSEKLFSLSRVDARFSLIGLIFRKTFAPTINLKELRLDGASMGGSLSFSLKLDKKISGPKDLLATLSAITVKGMSFRTDFIDIQGASGSISISPKRVTISGLRFVLNGDPCALNLELRDPADNVSGVFSIASSNISVNASVIKEGDIYKIPELKGKLLNSDFSFTGEFQDLKTPVLSLYGETNLNIADISFFLPEDARGNVDSLGLSGTLSNSFYFKGDLRNRSDWEIGVKSSATRIKVGAFNIDKINIDARVKNGILTVPLVNAYPYGGVFVASLSASIIDKTIPYDLSCNLNNLNIAGLLQDTDLGEKGIRGLFFASFKARGNLKNAASVNGSGRFAVTDANLGPMPLLTPLLGKMYGYMQYLFPGIKKVDINQGSCDFYVQDRKIITENLILEGDMMALRARGYVDFDTNLRFEVENEFKEPEAQAADWQSTFQGMIANVGKVISKSYLTGTLRKPEWKFEYLSGVKNMFGGSGLDQVLKGIFEE